MKKYLRNVIDDEENIIGFFHKLFISALGGIRRALCNWSENYYNILLVVLLVIGCFIRYFYINLGLPYIYYFDEPQIINVAIQMIQDGDFNPHFFRYPTLTTYLQVPLFILNYFILMGNGDLTSLNGILIGRDYGYSWSISHPSFCSIARLSMIILFMGTVFVTYLLGKKYFNRKTGIFAAMILTFFTVTWGFIAVNPNVTVGFLVVLVLFVLSLYKSKAKVKYILIAGFIAGLAVAAKYNVFLIISPVILAVLLYSKNKIRDVFIVLGMYILGFVVGCPYALLDLSTFLDQAGDEVRHYKLLGRVGRNAGVPGISQIKFYLNLFKGWATSFWEIKVAWYFCIVGIIVYAVRKFKDFVILFSFPILYVLYMSQQRVNYTRNMICVIPFVVLSAAYFLYLCYMLCMGVLEFAKKKNIIKFRINKEIIFILIFAILLMSFHPVSRIRNSYSEMKNKKDVRTEAIDYMKENFRGAKIGIAKQLRIYNKHLERLPNSELIDVYSINLDDLYHGGYEYIIAANEYTYSGKDKIKNVHILAMMNIKFPKQNIVKTFGNDVLNLNSPNANPKINIYRVDRNFLEEVASIEKYNLGESIRDKIVFNSEFGILHPEYFSEKGTFSLKIKRPSGDFNSIYLKVEGYAVYSNNYVKIALPNGKERLIEGGDNKENREVIIADMAKVFSEEEEVEVIGELYVDEKTAMQLYDSRIEGISLFYD